MLWKAQNLSGRSVFTTVMLLLGAYLWASGPSLLLEHNEPSNYADAGEALIHNIPSHPSHLSTFRLSLANIAAGLIFYHSGVSPQAWAHLFHLTQAALILTAAYLMTSAPWLPLAAALLFLLLEPNTIAPQYPQSLFSIMILVAVNLLIDRARNPTYLKTVLFAVAIGATLLFRSTLLFFPPLLACFEWLSLHRRSSGPYRKELLTLCLLPYLFVLPTLNLNWKIHHKLIPLENGASSFNIVTGALGITGTADGMLTALIDDPSVDHERSGSVLIWAAGQVLQHPIRYLNSLGRRLLYVISLNFLLWPLALMGLWLFRKRREFAVLGLLSFYFLSIHCLMSVQRDYFLPLWPILCLLAAGPALLIPGRATEHERPPSRVPGDVAKAGLGLMLALSFFTALKTASYRVDDCSANGCVEEALDKALLAHPEDIWLLNQRGKTRLRQRRVSLAIEDFSRSAVLDPGNRFTRLLLAGASASRGDPALILDWKSPVTPYADLRDSADITFNVHVQRALVHLRRRQAKEASASLEAAYLTSISGYNKIRLVGTKFEVEVLERIKSADSRFADSCHEASYFWPIEDRARLFEALAGVKSPDYALRIRQADIAIEAGDKKAAIKLLVKAESLSGGAEGRQLAISARYRSLAEHLRASAASPHDVQLLLEAAQFTVRAGRKKEALAFLASAEAESPSPRPRRQIAMLYLDLKEYDRADAQFEVLSAASDNAEPWVQRAELAARAGRKDAALELLARAATKPGDEDVRRRAASLLRQLRPIQRPIQQITHLVEEARIERNQGPRLSALETLAALDARPDITAMERVSILDQYRRLREYRRGLAFLTKQSKLHPEDPALRVDTAEFAIEAGEPNAARAALARADELKLGDAALLRMSLAYVALRDDRRAYALMTALLARTPGDAVLWLARAELETRTGARGAALASLARAEALHPGNEDHNGEQRRRVALAYQALKEYDRAIDIFARLTRQYPADASFYSDKALSAHLKGSNAAAVADLRTAIRLEPNFLPAYVTLGAVHTGLGRFTEALKVYDEALSNTSAADADPLRAKVIADRKAILSKASR